MDFWVIQLVCPWLAKEMMGAFRMAGRTLHTPLLHLSAALWLHLYSQYPVSPPRPTRQGLQHLLSLIFSPLFLCLGLHLGFHYFFAYRFCILVSYSIDLQSPVTIMWFALEDVVDAVGAFPYPLVLTISTSGTCIMPGAFWLRKCREMHIQERMPQLLRVVVPPSSP